MHFAGTGQSGPFVRFKRTQWTQDIRVTIQPSTFNDRGLDRETESTVC